MKQEPWHSISIDDILKTLESSEEGLSTQEAQDRIEQYGPNALTAAHKESALRLFLRQFNSPLIYILLASSILTIAIGAWSDTAVILSVVLLNTLIGFIQDYKSGQAIEALLQMVPEKARTLRDNRAVSLLAAALVPGDIVLLEAGDKVPADIRLIMAKNFKCDEAALTGESLPVNKKTDVLDEETALAERNCMAYSGTFVTTGIAKGIVVETGQETEFGKISSLLKEVHTFTTPLLETLKKVATALTIGIASIGIGVFLIGYYRGYSILDAALSSIALAVAAIPEGLPATITITAAIGVQKMAKKQAIIRKLPAVETLGSTTVICTDKTGTLTENQMTVRSICTPDWQYSVKGQGYIPEGEIIPETPLDAKKEEVFLQELLIASILCNDASLSQQKQRWIFSGDPTELALIVAARKEGLHEETLRHDYPRIDVIPFASEQRFMATLHDHKGQRLLFIKGSPETIFSRCENLDFDRELVQTLARKGMRVLAVAKKELPSSIDTLDENNSSSGFTFLGLLGMIDPPREGVVRAIHSCKRAGITVKMITGDHPLTAEIISDELGLINHGQVMTGADLDELNDEEFEQAVQKNNIFARALPIHKLKIVSTLQKQGEVVAMTGDGVNDSPALKQAHIGIAMGIAGTSVAKEVADMILADDNFTSIEKAIEEGRRIFDNLIKSLAFMLPTNLAQALMIIVAILFFPIERGQLLLPIMPLQILWVNLVTSVALALPLAFEAMEPDVMRHPPRKPHQSLLGPQLWTRMALTAAIMVAGTTLMFLHLIETNPATLQTIREGQTMAVTTLMFFQIIYLLHCRSLRYSFVKIGIFSNPYIWIGIGTTLLAQMAFIYIPPMNALFGTTPISPLQWAISFLVSLILSPVIILEKWISRRSPISR